MPNLSNAFGNTAKNFGDKSGYNTASTSTPEFMIGEIIFGVLQFLGILFLGLMIYGGFLWMTASGEESKVKTAKDILLNAVIGLAIVALAYSISYFVLQGVLQNNINTIGN